MACTFDPNLGTNKDWVRLLTGDTDVPAGCILSDEEINALVAEVVSEHGSGVHTKYCAASLAGTALAAVALSAVSAGDVLRKVVGRLSITRQSGVDMRTAYQSHIDSLEARCNELMVSRPRTFESIAKARY